jgi:hypothetical protein
MTIMSMSKLKLKVGPSIDVSSVRLYNRLLIIDKPTLCRVRVGRVGWGRHRHAQGSTKVSKTSER